MSEDRTYICAGTSIKKGVKAFRVANISAAARANILLKDNHSEVKLVDLPSPMTKEAAQIYIESLGDSVPVIATVQKVHTPRVVISNVPRVAKPGAVHVPGTRTRRSKDDETLHPLFSYVDPNKEILHDEIGFAFSKLGTREYWLSRPVIVRQEYARNAAWAKGIKCPKGTYPELEESLIAEGIVVNEDGTLTDTNEPQPFAQVLQGKRAMG